MELPNGIIRPFVRRPLPMKAGAVDCQEQHKLRGDRQGQRAMTINGPWRVCFEFRKGDAYNVEITDDHKG